MTPKLNTDLTVQVLRSRIKCGTGCRADAMKADAPLIFFIRNINKSVHHLSRILPAMRVFITAATVGEWMPCFSNINKLYTEKSKRFKIYFHQSGVGMMASCYSLTKLVMEEKPDLVLQVGMAGC